MKKHSVKTRSVSVTEIMIDKEDLINIGEIIYGLLKKSKSCQIFLAANIYESLVSQDILIPQNYIKGFHYGGDDDMFGIERPYDVMNSKRCTFAELYFASNCDDYAQVTYFYKNKLEYTHYMEKMKKIYIITFA